MTNPYTKDSLIHCDIQADNKLEILTCVRESFVYMPGWTYESSAQCAEKEHPDSRFFTFDLTQKSFMWWRKNDTFSDTEDADEVIIKDMADISHLLQFVYDNSDELRKNLVPTSIYGDIYNPHTFIIDSVSSTNPCGEQKKKRKKDESHLNLSHLYQKLKEAAMNSGWPMWVTQQKTYVQNEGYSQYYYQDYASGGKSLHYPPTVKVKMYGVMGKKDITLEKYDSYKYTIASPNIHLTALKCITQDLMGLHGPLADEIRKLAKDKADEILKANAAQKQAEKDAKDAAQGVLGSWKAFQQASKKSYNANNNSYKDAVIKFLPYKKEDLKFYYNTKPKTWKQEYNSTWDY